MNRKDFETGLILGLVSPPVPHVVKKEPIAYSYNGVILPKLPEWDREVYPYAVLQDNGNYHRLTISSKPIYGKASGDKVYFSTGSNAEGRTWELYPGDTEWDEGWWTPSVLVLVPVLWANHDVLYEDGNLYLAKSDPIPVYE